MDLRIAYSKKVTKSPPSYVAVVNGCYDSPTSKRQQIKLNIEETSLPIDNKHAQATEYYLQRLKLDNQDSIGLSNNNSNSATFSSRQNLLGHRREQVYFVKPQYQNTPVCF